MRVQHQRGHLRSVERKALSVINVGRIQRGLIHRFTRQTMRVKGECYLICSDRSLARSTAAARGNADAQWLCTKSRLQPIFSALSLRLCGSFR